MTPKRTSRPTQTSPAEYPTLARVDRRTVLLGVGALAALSTAGCTNPAEAGEPAKPVESPERVPRLGGKEVPADVPAKHEAMSGKKAPQDLPEPPAPAPPAAVDGGVRVPPEPALGGKPVPPDVPHPPPPAPAGPTGPTKLGLNPGPATPLPTRPPRR